MVVEGEGVVMGGGGVCVMVVKVEVVEKVVGE